MHDVKDTVQTLRKSLILCLYILISLTLICCSTSPSPKNAVQPTVEKSTPLQGKIVIDWQDAEGYNTYGFNILRGESREGPFIKLNKDIIMASTKSKPPHTYRFIDQPLEIGKIYYYYVESVDYAGQKKQMTPLSKVVVKTPVDEPDTPPESQ